MALDQLSRDDKIRLNQFIEAAMKIFQDIADQQAGLKDQAKALAEEFDVKPGVLMKAARAAFKANIDDQKDEIDTVENILAATGRR
jgi:hypothetical protein